MSVTMRTAGSGGQIHSFCAMNSFSMSFCMVPPSRLHATDCLSAMARYMASATDAGQLIVLEAVTSPSGMPAKRRSKSAAGAGGVGVVAHQRAHGERGGEPPLALGQPVLEPRVGGLRAPEPREHAH